MATTRRVVLDEHVDPNDPPEYRGEPITVEIKSQSDEHEGHETERIETLYDNPIEHTLWGYCRTCRVEFMIESTTWLA